MMHRFTIWPVLLLMLLATGCAEQREEREAQQLYQQAEQFRAADNYDKAVETLQQLSVNYPDTKVAQTAIGEIQRYEELEEIQMQNQRQKIQNTFSSIGRALENYKSRFLDFPLAPKDLEKLPNTVMKPEWDDVWGRPVYYTPTYSSADLPPHKPDGYALATFGEDGLPGGTGKNQDYFYKNGKVVAKVTE